MSVKICTIIEKIRLRPHQGAVKATRTFWSPPTCSLKDFSSKSLTLLGGPFFVLGLIPVLSVMNLVRLSKSLPLLYSIGSEPFPSNHFSVGKPWTLNFLPRALCSSASTLAITTLSADEAKFCASSSYTGARVLQCPHQGAKNSTSAGLPDLVMTLSKLEGMRSMTAEDAEILRMERQVRRNSLRKAIVVVQFAES
jgi:hypothetical protein